VVEIPVAPEGWVNPLGGLYPIDFNAIIGTLR